MVTEFGIVKLVKELHPRKAACPISVTESGIIKLVKDPHPKKAAVEILVIGGIEG